MFTGKTIFSGFRTVSGSMPGSMPGSIPGSRSTSDYSQQIASGWFAIGPGLALTTFAVVIMIWPQLLAYLFGSMLLFGGLSLTFWGWSMNRSSRRKGSTVTYYEVS